MKPMRTAVLILLLSLTVCTPLIADEKPFKVSLGYTDSEGDTTYQIGGLVVSPSSSAAGFLPFPISELEFSLDSSLYTLGFEYMPADGFELGINIAYGPEKDTGKFKDSDWSYYKMLGFNWAEYGTLDVYSESDAEIETMTSELYFRAAAVNTDNFQLLFGLGLLTENHEYAVANLFQTYPSYPYYFSHLAALGITLDPDIQAGPVLDYEVTYTLPYYETALRFRHSGFSGEAAIGISQFVKAVDKDTHILRFKVSEGDCDGTATMYSLKAGYEFEQGFFLAAEYFKREIETDGTQEQVQYPYSSATGNVDYSVAYIDQEITSSMRNLTFKVGYRF